MATKTATADARIVTATGDFHRAAAPVCEVGVAPSALLAEPICPVSMEVVLRCNKPMSTTKYAMATAVITGS